MKGILMAQEEVTNNQPEVATHRNTRINQRPAILAGIIAILILVMIFIVLLTIPSYKILFNSLNDQDAIKVLNALSLHGFDAKLDEATGAILVPTSAIHLARIKLSNLGLTDMVDPYRSIDAGEVVWGLHTDQRDSKGDVTIRTNRSEEILSRRIENILEPLVGNGSVRAQVIANGSNDNVSITILLDDIRIADESGHLTRVKRSSEDLEKYADIVKKAIGFDSNRGDVLNLINSSFSSTYLLDSEVKAPVWGNNIYKWLSKPVFIIAVLTILLLAFLWLLYKSLFGSFGFAMSSSSVKKIDNMHALNPAELAEKNYQENMKKMNHLAMHDPKLVAQIIKNWVNADG